MTQQHLQLHASAVAINDAGILITGAAGTGKSTLALETMALGACLIADDLVILTRRGDTLFLSPPPGRQPTIEARGVGLIRLIDCVSTARCALIVDLDQNDKRLPERHTRSLLGIEHSVIFGRGRTGLASILKVLIGSEGLLNPDDRLP